MRSRRLAMGALLLAAACSRHVPAAPSISPEPQVTTTPPPQGPPGTWTLVFRDEFSGTRLDKLKWRTSYPFRRSPKHGELAGYASSAVRVAKGVLHLTATKKSTHGLPYTSGLISSAGKFTWTQGVAEIRLKTPRGVGYWPAFWTMNIPYGPYPPEIDMLELKGGTPGTIWMGHYWGVLPNIQGWQTTWTGADFTAGFHTVTVEWTPTSLTWYVDGVERARTTSNIPQTGMYLMANLAVGGTFAGNPTPATAFPGTMRVDYIRVWQ